MEDLITIYYDSEIKSVFLKTDNTTVIGETYNVFTGVPANCLAIANLFNLGNIEMLTDFILNLNTTENEEFI